MELTYDKSSRTPVDRAFYESFIMRDRWKVTRLYAQNMSASVKFKKEVKHLGFQRKSSLMKLDNEIEKTRRQLGQFHLEQDQVLHQAKEKEEIKSMKTIKTRKTSRKGSGKAKSHQPEIFPVKNKGVATQDTNKQIKVPLPIVKESKSDIEQNNASRRHKISLPSLSMSSFQAILPNDSYGSNTEHRKKENVSTKKVSVGGSYPEQLKGFRSSSSNDPIPRIKVRKPGETGMFDDLSASADESGVSAAEIEGERLQSILEMMRSNNSEVFLLSKGDSKKPSRAYKMSVIDSSKPSLTTVDEIETITYIKNNTEKTKKMSTIKKLAFENPNENITDEKDGGNTRKFRSKNIEGVENEILNIGDGKTGDSLMQLVSTINRRNRSKSLFTEPNKRKISTSHPLDNVGDLEISGKKERISINKIYSKEEPFQNNGKERKPSEYTTISYSLSKNYNNFFKDEDFIETKAKYIPRDMHANLGSLLLS